MNTEYLKITGEHYNDAEVIDRAARVIQNGGLVAIPTETVYGLAGSALIPTSAEKIFSAKGRPADNPLIVHIAKPEEAETLAYTCDAYYKLAERFMPGPLTMILPKKGIVPDEVTAGLDSVAIRCPSNDIAHKLIEASGHPIAAPSANRSGIPSPTKAEHVLTDMDGRIDMIIDGGECDIGLESTVIKLTDDGCVILRPGAVTEEMLAEVCDVVTVAKAVIEPSVAAEERVESPGMKYKHYSPKADVILVDANMTDFVAYVNANSDNKCGVFSSNEYRTHFTSAATLITGEHPSARDESKSLFHLLRKADEMGLERVYIKLPEAKGEYLALYNRLIRASGGKIVKPE
ncbi:MAG: threonylcarbamoyl-AMP synthase [Ruminococcaceae bacterium]|nr:threonylcarbamoyl-AMP synthase [Oscillospiraceae bacterium]